LVGDIDDLAAEEHEGGVFSVQFSVGAEFE
jgi:hypothetical protein